MQDCDGVKGDSPSSNVFLVSGDARNGIVSTIGVLLTRIIVNLVAFIPIGHIIGVYLSFPVLSLLRNIINRIVVLFDIKEL